MLLPWNDAYKTGHPLIDEQHKSIIDAMNPMHEAVEAGKIREEVPGILHFLESYIEEHFGYEERCALCASFIAIAEQQPAIHRQNPRVLLG